MLRKGVATVVLFGLCLLLVQCGTGRDAIDKLAEASDVLDAEDGLTDGVAGEGAVEPADASDRLDLTPEPEDNTPGGIDTFDVCVPDCEDKECGDNGCGGSCGECDDDDPCTLDSCVEGLCLHEKGFSGCCDSDDDCVDEWDCTVDVCWISEGKETGYCDSYFPSPHCAMPDDCQQKECHDIDCVNCICIWTPKEDCCIDDAECGDAAPCEMKKCVANTCLTLPADCDDDNPATVDSCDPETGECVHCWPDCDGKDCGPDGCGGICGVCFPGDFCQANGKCNCLPDCEGKECGPDGCAGSCGECPEGQVCDNGTCGQASPDAPWPMARRDARRSGLSPHEGPEGAGPLWINNLDGWISYTAPVIDAAGNIYVATSQPVSEGDTSLLAAFSPDGDLLWTEDLGGLEPSTPALSPEGRVYVALGSSGTLRAYDTTLGNPDKLVWSLGWGDGCSPAIGQDGSIYGCHSAAHPDGTLKWSAPLAALDAVISGSALGSGDTVLAVGMLSSDPLEYGLAALSQEMGTVVWSFSLGSDPSLIPMGTMPVVAEDGTVYYYTRTQPGWDAKGLLHALTPDGALKWTLEHTLEFSGIPALGPEGAVYVGTHWGPLVAVEPDGVVKWESSFSQWWTAPAVDLDGTIYVWTLSLPGMAIPATEALNPDGSFKWAFGPAWGFEGSPAIGADGRLCFSGSYYGLVCLGADG